MEFILFYLIRYNCLNWIIISFMLLSTSPIILLVAEEDSQTFNITEKAVSLRKKVRSPNDDTQVFRIDPLALLSATLRTYQRAGCDSEFVTLSCPRGTSISIDVAQYGRSDNVDNLCPSSTEESLDVAMSSGTEIEIKQPESCTWSHALQYSLLQTVVEACQKKRHCKFLASPRTFGGDPCPGLRKFIEVAYKCRPYEFRSKIACENDVIQLICNPYSRIAVYGASFGRTEYESLQCGQPQGVREETCLASYGTETVMQKCHGRRKCTLSADSTTFGKPCRPESRMYLKVVYTCVPRKVLKDRFDTAPEPDEPLQSDLEQDQDELYDEDQFYRESEAIPPGPAPKLQANPSNRPSETPNLLAPSSIKPPSRTITDLFEENEYSFEANKTKSLRSDFNNNEDRVFVEHGNTVREDDNEAKVIGFITEWVNAYIFMTQNQERLYLYLIISVTAAILLCLSIVIGRLLVQKRRREKNQQEDNKFQTSNTGETTIPNGFSDDISEIDADIDLTTPLPVPSVSRSDDMPYEYQQNYGAYTPSPGPYGNIGPSNISHTSTTMLVPPNINSIMSVAPPPQFLGGPVNMMPSSSINQSLSQVRHPMPLVGTLPRHHGASPPIFLGGVMANNQSQTLRRQSDQDGSNTPRSLSRGVANTQFYYG